MAKTDLTKNLLARFDKLKTGRQNWETHWQEVADYMQPRKAEITRERARGDKRNIQIFDATAIHALELLAASLHGMLTSSANRWFSLRYKEDQLNDMLETKEKILNKNLQDNIWHINRVVNISKKENNLINF